MRLTNNVYEWDSLPVVLKLPDVCRILHVCDRTARKYLQAGEIPSIKVGKSYVVERDKLRRYLEG